jgi:hypothetical protein
MSQIIVCRRSLSCHFCKIHLLLTSILLIDILTNCLLADFNRIEMATRVLHLMHNCLVKRTRYPSYIALIPGGIGLFKSPDTTRIPSRQYPPSLNRTTLLLGKFARDSNHNSFTAENIARDPVRMVIKSTTASKRESGRQLLRSRLVVGERFIKDVAETVTAKNDVTLSVRLKRAFTDYGKVGRPMHAASIKVDAARR